MSKSLAELAEVSITETDTRQQRLWLFEGLFRPVLYPMASLHVNFIQPKLDRKLKWPVATMRVFSPGGCWKMDVASGGWSKKHRGETVVQWSSIKRSIGS